MGIGQSKRLRDVLDLVRGAEMSPTRRRDMLSAIERLCEMLARPPAGVPLDVPELRALLRGIRPVAHGISGKTFANIRSLVASAIALTGQLDGSVRGLAKQHPAWGPLMQALANDHALATGLAAFTNWCAARDVAPGDVTDLKLLDFLAWLENRTLHPRPRELARRIPVLWERARAEIDGWPETRLARLSFKRPARRLSWADLPEGFRRDGEAYIAKRRSPDFFDDSGRAPRRPLADATLRLQREHLRLAASVLLADVGLPADQLTSLACLVRPDAFKGVLRFFMERARRKALDNATGDPTAVRSHEYPASAFIVGMASTLIQAALYHTGATPEGINALRRWAAKLPAVPLDLAPKNKILLRQLEAKEVQARLQFLPEQLLSEVAHAKNIPIRLAQASMG